MRDDLDMEVEMPDADPEMKRVRVEEAERGAKSDDDEWEQLAKKIKTGSLQRMAEETKEGNEVLDDLMQEINATMGNTGEDEDKVMSKLRDLADEFQSDEEGGDEDPEWRESDLDQEKVCQAREEELRELERRVFEVVDVQECWDKTNKPPIGVRWVDVHKGEGIYRSRLVAKDFRPKSRVGDVEGLFAAMPPLELVKLIIVMAAEECRLGRIKKVMMIDIGKAHLYAPIKGDVYVELPPERAEEGKCAKLLYTLYGMRTAASSWEGEYTKTLVEAGFVAGRANACTFFHPHREIRIVVHGDDFVVTGGPAELEFVKDVFKRKYPTKVRGVMGPNDTDDKEVTILNRVVRWMDDGVTFEADPKHVVKMLQDMRLGECQPVLLPGSRDQNDGEDAPLEGESVAMYRSVVARANYLSLDRADIRYSTKELCRRMAGPRRRDWRDLKKLCRYLRGRTRMIQGRAEEKFVPGVIEVFVDSDWAGCPETRRSTSGGAVMVHGMCLKTWSSTQRVVARSSGEAELYAAVRGAAEGLGLRAMAQDLGWCWPVRMWSDSSSCRGTCNRSGLGRLKHVEVENLWLQEAVKHHRIVLSRVSGMNNPADLMTKFLVRAQLDRHALRLGLRDA